MNFNVDIAENGANRHIANLMLRHLKQLFWGDPSNRLVVDAYWCESSIKLPAKVRTLSGSNIAIVNACVDIQYSIDQGNIALKRVRLSRGGGRIFGSNTSINVTSRRTGEGWFSSRICSKSQLREAVEKDLSTKDSRLRKIMMSNSRDVNRNDLTQALVDALNAQASSGEINQLLLAAGRGTDIVFTYTKPNGNTEMRYVSVQGVSGNSIRAHDHKDGKTKSFRIDRIHNARNA